MALRYCNLCQRNVETKRHFGIGTLVMCLFTLGIWLLAMPLYSKRCPVCRGSRRTMGSSTVKTSSISFVHFLGLAFGVIVLLSILGNIFKPTENGVTSSVAPVVEQPRPQHKSMRSSILRQLADASTQTATPVAAPTAMPVSQESPAVVDSRLPAPAEFAKSMNNFDTFLHKPGGEGFVRLMGIQIRKGPIPRATVAVTEHSIPGITPLPTFNKNPLDCGERAKSACTEAEIAEQIQITALSWADLPEAYRQQCLSSDTPGAMGQCIDEHKIVFMSQHIGEELVDLAKENQWLYNYDQHGGHTDPAPGPLFLPQP